MNTATPSIHKVKTVHLQRDAYLYVRQSSMRQVMENTESTKDSKATGFGQAASSLLVHQKQIGTRLDRQHDSLALAGTQTAPQKVNGKAVTNRFGSNPGGIADLVSANPVRPLFHDLMASGFGYTHLTIERREQ